jgi:hypothetical protein
MAILDTLKLARALRDQAGFSAQSAEATAAALGSALGDAVATKADLDRAEGGLRAEIERVAVELRAEIERVAAELRAEIAAVKADVRLLQWQVAIMWALQIAILVKLFVH